MLPPNPLGHASIDENGLIRAWVLVWPGHEWMCLQRCHRVTAAVAFALGEKSDHWHSAPPAARIAEVEKHRQASTIKSAPPTVGIYKISDPHGTLLAMVVDLEGRAEECQRIANQVVVKVSAFMRQPCTAQRLGLQEALATLPTLPT